MIRLNSILLLSLIFSLPLIAHSQYASTGKKAPELSFEESRIAEVHNKTPTQQSTNRNRFWVNAGLGAGTPGLAGIISASYQFSGSNLLSLRGAITGEVFGDEFWDIGLLYGVATSEERHHASVSAGVAIMGINRNKGMFSPPEKTSPLFGFPVQGQLFWRPADIFGLGLTGFLNINTERTFAGLAVSLQLGRLR